MKKDSILPTEAEILHALRDINPFWANKDWPDLPAIRRYPFYSAVSYLQELGSQRAIFFRGFRGVGKSTLLRQIGAWLRNEQKIETKNIVYVDFEKRPLRQIPWNVWFNTWEKELKPTEGLVYAEAEDHEHEDGARRHPCSLAILALPRQIIRAAPRAVGTSRGARRLRSRALVLPRLWRRRPRGRPMSAGIARPPAPSREAQGSRP